MLTSANYARDESVTLIGEEIATELDFSNPELKVYYSRYPSIRTHLPDGAEIIFRGGMFATANKEIKDFLDKTADKPTSLIYTKKDSIAPQLDAVAEEAAKTNGSNNAAVAAGPKKP